MKLPVPHPIGLAEAQVACRSEDLRAAVAQLVMRHPDSSASAVARCAERLVEAQEAGCAAMRERPCFMYHLPEWLENYRTELPR